MALNYQRPQRFLERYADPIESIIGTAYHVTDFNKYTEALEHIGKIKDYKTNVNKLMDIQNRLLDVQTDKIPTTKTRDKEVFNSSYFNLLSDDELKSVNALTGYTEYADRETKKGNTPLSPDEYLSQRPELYANLKTQFPNAFKIEKEQVSLTNDEVLAEYYKAANISPEEVAWYQENKGKYKATQYNEQLTDLMNKYIPYFINRQGGEKFAGLLQGTIKSEYIVPPQMKYEKIGEDIIGINLLDGSMKVVYKGDKKEKWTPDAQIPVAYFEKDGNIYVSQIMKNEKGDTRTETVNLGSDKSAVSLYDSWKTSQKVRQGDLSDVEKANLSAGMNITIDSGIFAGTTVMGKDIKKGGSKNVADKLTKGEKLDKSDLDAIFGDWYNNNQGSLSPKERDAYLDAKAKYKFNNQLTEDEFNKKMKEYETATSKTEKNIFRDISKNYVSTALINAQKKTVEDTIRQWQLKVNAKLLSPKELQTLLLNFFIQNKDKFYTPIREALEKELKRLGLL